MPQLVRPSAVPAALFTSLLFVVLIGGPIRHVQALPLESIALPIIIIISSSQCVCHGGPIRVDACITAPRVEARLVC